MASPPGLLAQLQTAPEQFELFRAVQILEQFLARMAPNDAGDDPGATADMPAGPAIRFSSHQSLSFPPTEVRGLESRRPHDRTSDVRLIVNLMGLTGSLGALPQVYSELALRALHARNPAFTQFLDLFNDRLIRLLHEAWRRYRLPALTETHGRAGTDPARAILYAIAGLGQPSLRNRLRLEDEPLAYYAGLFGQMPKSAISLEQLIADFTGLPVRIEQFQARRVAIPLTEQTAVPATDAGGSFNQLGVDAIVGEAMLDVQGCFRVVLGALTYPNFLAYLPGRPAVLRLNDLVRTYVGPDFSYEIQLVLRRDQIPPCILPEEATSEGAMTGGPRLGWNSWVTSLPPLVDAGDAVFDADGMVRVVASAFE
ncbi:type VI secretion system baseplate subunit TssG [Aliidongia dinghuensis]|uniref:type VI secretion system baseplate subunit TssG n=1 Tax=Aliidongia dinghuensis TaxID=1867774 RepID=UPI0016651D89|nr:type VI secretion system baseplate subunit TssG [Aliidongia dinghuensis]